MKASFGWRPRCSVPSASLPGAPPDSVRRSRREPQATRRLRERPSGYTLLELVVGIGLLTVLALPMFGLQIRVMRIQKRAREVVASGLEASKALESILADARASAAVGPGSGDDVLVLFKRYPEEETITYQLNESTSELVRESSLRGETVVASGLRSVSFQYEPAGDEAGFVRVTVEGGVEGGSILRLVGGAELRNRP